MPICSYLVHPQPGKTDALRTRLNAVPGCQAIPAKAHDLLILITETETMDEENHLQETLKTMEGIECLALSFGQVEEPLPPQPGACS